MKRKIIVLTALCVIVAVMAPVMAVFAQLGKDSLRFPISDRRSDRFTAGNKNPFDLSDTSIIKQNIEYDPKTNQYYIKEKVGNTIYRKPTSLSFEEYYALKTKKDESEYFKQRADALAALNKKTQRPKPNVYSSLFDRIFGVNNIIPKNGANPLKIDIKPQGSVDISMGYQGQNTLNPTLPENARKTGGFDFNMNANLNVNANIGDKLKLPFNYNTLANFDYLNKMKLDYKGMDDEIIRSIEAGNISFQSKGTLISSAQNLFGVKAQLQFGKLTVTGVIANQNSQTQSQKLQGGAAVTSFQKKLDDYDENRNFLLAQYFRNNYNKAMSSLPVVNSQVQIQRVEVWVTNKTGASTDARYVVGLMDLGEYKPYNASISSLTSNPLPDNGSNNVYSSLINNVSGRNPSLVSGVLQARGLNAVDDYEKTFARKLSSSEYYFNPQIGFISINAQLQPDDVLAIAYQYTYNGKVYQVGEFSQDIGLDSTQGVQKVLYLKLLKATSARINLPIWKLMMKNVYSLNMSNISKDGFKLNLLYQQPSGGNNIYLPEASPAANGKSLLSILRLDRLNSRNDPQPDGVFDYVEGYTIVSQYGKIIFPVLEPFGGDLDTLAFAGQSQSIKQKYVYRQLYDSIKAIAQTYANLDRFSMQGTAKGSSSSDIYLNAVNVPQGSVKVTAGSQILQEGSDYTIDYNLGTVKIINQAIINSGVAVNVSYENNAGVGMQQRGFMGLRLDYAANKKLAIGATMERLNERPFFTKMSYGEDPIRNSMFGVDFSYKSEWQGLTRALNKLPFYSTHAKSFINAYGEAAYFKPGHPPQIGTGSGGLIYVDDFEGTTSNIDLRFPLVSWALASTPQGTTEFPEASLDNDLTYGKNRAKLAWYNIEPNLQDKNASNNPLKQNIAELSDPRVRMVYTNELYPQQTTNITNTQTITFDLSYFPTDKGPYNFESSPSQIDANGKLKNPKNRWGGLMRSIDQTDFETNNIVYLEFLVQDPFIKNPNSTGGKLRINLGDVSEDILRDGKRFYENGLSTPNSPAAVDTSNWGRMPLNPIQTTNAFSNNADDRPYQDVGLDGMSLDSEKVKHKDYLAALSTNFGTNSAVYQKAIQDPSADDYVWYRNSNFDAAGTGILGRYKNYNNTEGNSPVVSGSSTLSPAATMYPDNEDLNHDNTLNQTEQYFEYEINLKPGMDVGSNPYIAQKQVVNVTYANGTKGTENWYLFRIPLNSYTRKIGNIPDFKSIRFVRTYLTGFDDSVTMRFASFNLVRDAWRQFNYVLDTTGSYTPIGTSNTAFNVTAVNLEQNSGRTPVNYLIPPGIERVQQLSNNGVNILLNEQSLSLQVRNLADGDARAVIKTVNFDLRNYGKLSMFAHAESVVNLAPVRDKEMNLVMRIGQDFLSNYYEVKIPLYITPAGKYSTAQDTIVWPTLNNLDFNLQDLINLKLNRNNVGASITNIYRQVSGNKTYSIMGNPNLGAVTGILFAVENAKDNNTAPINAEVWLDELRLSQINETGAYAATGRVDVTLADLGKVSVSVNTHSAGFGTLESHINDRSRDNLFQFDASMSIEAGKLMPKSARISMPVYASINRTVILPQYDPYDLDVTLKQKLSSASSKHIRDSIRNAAMDQTTIKTLNFTNVRIMPKGKPNLLKLSNFDVSYSYTQTTQSSPTIQNNILTKWRGNLGYTYNSPTNYKQPFKKVIKNKSNWLTWLRDFNFNLKPSLLSFRSDINRQFGQYVPKIVNTDLTFSKVTTVDTTYDKYFRFDRYYNARWDLSRSLNFDFSATNNAVIDEPYGAIDTKAKKDSVWKNFVKGGRNIMYQQRAVFSYTIPFNKFPLTDWMSGRYSYGTNYNWIAGSLLAIGLGNTIENGQENNFNTDFDLSRLYNKSRWLRSMQTASNVPSNKNNNSIPKQNPANTNVLGTVIATREEILTDKNGHKLTGKKKRDALSKWRQQKRDLRLAQRLQNRNQQSEVNPIVKTGMGLLTMIKHVSINYSENYHSRIPGYMDSTQILGQNWKSMQPGMDYVFGRQPDTNWLNQKAAKGLITKDSMFNTLYRQNFEQHFNFTAQLEPIREFRIDVSLDKTFTKEYTELFKDSTNTGSKQQHLSPYANGGFSVSYISFNTMFGKRNPNEITQTFRSFEDYRGIISKRVAEQNPYWGGTYTADGYAAGYGRYSQNVLIPAFLAAYTKKSPYTIGLIKESNGNVKSNPFIGILPKPNWRVSYTGLTRVPSLASIFSAITLTHAYSGTLSMNSYTSALNYADPFHRGMPGFIDSVSGNFVPFFLVPNITIHEQFSPLIGINITTTKQLNLKFEYKKERTMSLSLIDYQLSETNSTEWTFGFGYKKRGIRLPFQLPFMNGKKLQNDVTFKLDLSTRDDITTNSKLDQSNAYGTGGQKLVIIQPSIDYVLNNRLNLKFFFDQRRSTPYISTSSPTIITRAGIQVRISLAP